MAEGSRHQGRRPQQVEPQATFQLRQESLQATTPHRECFLSAQGLPPHRHSLRQVGEKLPRLRLPRCCYRLVDFMRACGRRCWWSYYPCWQSCYGVPACGGDAQCRGRGVAQLNERGTRTPRRGRGNAHFPNGPRTFEPNQGGMFRGMSISPLHLFSAHYRTPQSWSDNRELEMAAERNLASLRLARGYHLPAAPSWMALERAQLIHQQRSR